MPECLLWVLFAVVLIPVAALCLMLIYALALSTRLRFRERRYQRRIHLPEQEGKEGKGGVRL